VAPDVVGEAATHLLRIAAIETLEVARVQLLYGRTIDQVLDVIRVLSH
jgi:hypothetical protein